MLDRQQQVRHRLEGEPIGWRFRVIAGTIRKAVSDNIRLTGTAFCYLFFLSLIGYSAGALFWGDVWNQNPLGVAADISGVSFATAIAILCIGGILMLGWRMPRIPNIFKSQTLEEGRKQGREEGEKRFIDAAAGVIPDETIERIKERMEQSQR